MVDSIDRKLIYELQNNGRKKSVDLAKMLGLVEGTVRKRIKRLLNEDIAKIVAIPNMPRLGYDLVAMMGIQVSVKELRAVADSIARSHNVCYLAFITGRYDLMAIVMTRSSQELSRFIEKEISTIPGVLRTETFVHLDTIKGAWGFLETSQLIRNLDIPSARKS